MRTLTLSRSRVEVKHVGEHGDKNDLQKNGKYGTRESESDSNVESGNIEYPKPETGGKQVMKKFFVTVVLCLLAVLVVAGATTLSAQQVNIGDQFVISWSSSIDQATLSGTSVLTYVGREGEFHAYKDQEGHTSLLTEDGQRRQVWDKGAGVIVYSPHQGLRPPPQKGVGSWNHTYTATNQGRRDLECTSTLSGPRQVSDVRFETSRLVRCTDQKAGVQFPRYWELVYVDEVPFPLERKVYWEGKNPGVGTSRLDRIIYAGSPPRTSLLVK